jgi:hypothetical protein
MLPDELSTIVNPDQSLMRTGHPLLSNRMDQHVCSIAQIRNNPVYKWKEQLARHGEFLCPVIRLLFLDSLAPYSLSEVQGVGGEHLLRSDWA